MIAAVDMTSSGSRMHCDTLLPYILQLISEMMHWHDCCKQATDMHSMLQSPLTSADRDTGEKVNFIEL